MSYKLGPKQRRGVGVGRGQVGWESGLAAMGGRWKRGVAVVGLGGKAVWPVWGVGLSWVRLGGVGLGEVGLVWVELGFFC